MNESGPGLVRQVDRWMNANINKGLPQTLVILHDDLEAKLGKLCVRRGGPEQASLRGHRGLISIVESLQRKGLYHSPLSILRVGVGIGRPESRKPGVVADYVLTEMTPSDLRAVCATAGDVVDLLVDEMYNTEQE